MTMMNIIFQADKKQQKITVEELQNQTAKVLPNREELIVMDYSMLNNPAYATPGFGHGSFNHSSFGAPTTFAPNTFQHPTFTPTQFDHNFTQPIPNQYDWAGYGNVNANIYAYGTYPQHVQYDPDCNFQTHPNGHAGWNKDWDHGWGRDIDDNKHDWKHDGKHDWGHGYDKVDNNHWGKDNWGDWQYKAFVYPNPHFDGTRLA